MNDVGCIQSASQSDLDHRGLHTHFAKEPEGHGGDRFKVSRVTVEIEFSSGLVDDFKSVSELLAAHLQPADLNPFGWFNQVGRSEKACLYALGAQAGVDH